MTRTPAPTDTDLVLAVSKMIARKVRRQLGAEMTRTVGGDRLQHLVWFGAVSGLIVEIFTVAPTKRVTPPTKAERRALFQQFLKVTTDDFEATLDTLPGE